MGNITIRCETSGLIFDVVYYDVPSGCLGLFYPLNANAWSPAIVYNVNAVVTPLQWELFRDGVRWNG